MDPREIAFREYVLELLEEARKKYPKGYAAIELSMDHHKDVISGGFHEPKFTAHFYVSPDGTNDNAVTAEGTSMKDLISAVNK